MTIRFLKPWNGYQPDAVVTGLTNEAALIAGGLASDDLDGGNDGRIYEAKFATDASGNVTGLVGPDGNLVDTGLPAKLLPWRIATWGQERAYLDSSAPEIIGIARFTDIRSPWWVAAYRGDMKLVADYGIGAGGTGITAANWNSASRSQGRTFASFASKAGSIDAVIFNYGGADIVLGNGTTPTAATVLGYLQANLLAFFRLGIKVIVESIYPYMDVAVYRGVASGWTAQGSGTAAQKQAIADSVNSQLENWINTYWSHMAVFVDVATTLKDGGTYAARKYMIDGIELNREGARVVGKLVADATHNLLPLRRAKYWGQEERSTAPETIQLTPTWNNYYGAAGSNGTITWDTPVIGEDATYGPYVELNATCSAITGLTPKNITNVTWDSGYLRFTVASHNMIPTQNFTVTGISGSVSGALTGPYSVSSNDSETVFSAPLASDPGTITIAGTPPSSSATIVVQEAFSLFDLFTEIIKSTGSPATGVSLDAGDMLEGTCWIYADDGAGGTPPLSVLGIRQRISYAAGTPTYVLSDGGIFQPATGNPAFGEGPLGPVRMHTPPMTSSNTTSGASSNVSSASAPYLGIGPVFNSTGRARIRVYSPSIRIIRKGPISVTTPASGSAWQNDYPVPVRVVMAPNGATVSAATIDLNDANVTHSLGAGFLGGGIVTLDPQDRLILTYTGGTPTLKVLIAQGRVV